MLNNNEKNFNKESKIFDVETAVNEIHDLLRDKINMKNIVLKDFYSGFSYKEKVIKSDQKRLQQVFLNLLSNAVKFTEREGSIKVMVEQFDKDDKTYLRLSVTDDGAGIKEENQDKLFQLFSTFKDTKKNLNP